MNELGKEIPHFHVVDWVFFNNLPSDLWDKQTRLYEPLLLCETFNVAQVKWFLNLTYLRLEFSFFSSVRKITLLFYSFFCLSLSLSSTPFYPENRNIECDIFQNGFYSIDRKCQSECDAMHERSTSKKYILWCNSSVLWSVIINKDCLIQKVKRGIMSNLF